MIRILAADDQPLFRGGTVELVANQSDMSVAGEASNGLEAIEQFRALRPDVTLMDLQMPEMNGLDAMIAILGEFPEARIIVLTTCTCGVQVLRALKAGQELICLRTYCIRSLSTPFARSTPVKRLSPEISYQVAEHANKEIAAQFSVPEGTVKGRVRRILAKLGAKDRTHAAMIGLKRGVH